MDTSEPTGSRGGPSQSSGAKLGGEQESGCQQRLSVIVSRGDPIDAPQYRHTGLYIEHVREDGLVTPWNFLDVQGSAGMFERYENLLRDPTRSDLFVARVHVADIPVTGPTDSRLRDVIWGTEVNNEEYDWNCQSWVGDALSSCVKAGLISSDECSMAIDRMADYILQAPDTA